MLRNAGTSGAAETGTINARNAAITETARCIGPSPCMMILEIGVRLPFNLSPYKGTDRKVT